MNFKEWLLNEDVWQNNTATVFHRTCKHCNEEDSIKAVSGILTSDFKTGSGFGCMYGCGLYTTLSLESQFTDTMFRYGKAVVKFKATELDKYLIFQLSLAKQIHGKDYKISDQLKKLGVLDKVDQNGLKYYLKKIGLLSSKGKLKYYDKQQEKLKHSSVLAQEFYEQNKWIENSIKGIIYKGEQDGYCLLKYQPVQDGTITMLAYAVAYANDKQKMKELKNNDGWIKSVGVLGTSIKNVYKSPSKMKEKLAFGDNATIVDQLLKSKNLEKTAQKLGSYLDKLNNDDVFNLLKNSTDKEQMAKSLGEKNMNKLTERNFYELLESATDKQKILEIITKYKTNLSGNDVQTILLHAKDKEQIANKLGTLNISKISTNEIYYLFKSLIYKKSIIKIINQYHTKKTPEMQELIDEYKSKLLGDNVVKLFRSATNKTQMAKKLGSLNISELDYHDIYELIAMCSNVKEKKQMAQIINQYHIKKNPVIQELLDKHIH